MVEFLEELIDADPSAEYPRRKLDDGSLVPMTGDEVVDEWSATVAKGGVPDFMASFDAADQERIAARLKPKAEVVAATVEAAKQLPDPDEDEFIDHYDDEGPDAAT